MTHLYSHIHTHTHIHNKNLVGIRILQMNEQELKWNRLADILFPGQFNHVLCTHTTSILNVLLLRFLNLFFVVSLVVVILLMLFL